MGCSLAWPGLCLHISRYKWRKEALLLRACSPCIQNITLSSWLVGLIPRLHTRCGWLQLVQDTVKTAALSKSATAVRGEDQA